MHRHSRVLAVLILLTVIGYISLKQVPATAQENEKTNSIDQLAFLAIAPPPGNSGILGLYQLQAAPGEKPADVETTGYPINAAWSPDGENLAFIMITGQAGSESPPSDFDIYRINRQGANLAKLTDTPGCPEIGLAWSADSQALFFSGFCRDSQATTFWRLSPASGMVEKLGEVQWDGTWAVWSPDASKIALLAPRKADDGSLYDEINLTTPDGQGMVNLADDAHAGYQLQQTTVLSWSPQSDWLAYASRVQSTDQGEVNHVILVRPDASERKILYTSEPGVECLNPVWSLDGQQLAFTCKENLLTIRANGTDLKNLTIASTGLVIEYPVWSPNGVSLAFISLSTDGKRRLESILSDGTGRKEISEISAIQTFGLVWNPVALPVFQAATDTPGNQEATQATSPATETTTAGLAVVSTPGSTAVENTPASVIETPEAGQAAKQNSLSSIWLLTLLLALSGAAVFFLLRKTGKLPSLVKHEEERKTRRERRARERSAALSGPDTQPAKSAASGTNLAGQVQQEGYEEIAGYTGLLQQGIQQIRDKDIQGGIITLREYLESVPDDPTAWLWLGWACGLVKEFRSAERCFLRAERLGSTQAGEALEWLSMQRQ